MDFVEKIVSKEGKGNYKGELCEFWEKDHKCKEGSQCRYAHGREELRFPKLNPNISNKNPDKNSEKPRIFNFSSQENDKFASKCKFLNEIHQEIHYNASENKEDLPIIRNKPIDEEFSNDYNEDLANSFTNNEEEIEEIDDNNEGFNEDLEEKYEEKLMNPKEDWGHAYGKYGTGPDEWVNYLEANGIDPASDIMTGN